MYKNFNKINYNYYRVNLELNNTSKIKKIISYCESNQNIIYAMKTIGGSDLEIYFEFTQEEFLEFGNHKDLVDKFGQKFMDDFISQRVKLNIKNQSISKRNELLQRTSVEFMLIFLFAIKYQHFFFSFQIITIRFLNNSIL